MMSTAGTRAAGIVGRAEFAHCTWPAVADHLAPIRAEVRGWLGRLGLSGQAEDDVVVAVDEAVTNAVVHAYGPEVQDGTVDLIFWVESRALFIEVVDHGTWQTPPDRPAECGLGIVLMQRLVPAVLIRHDGRGTRVLLRHPLPAAPRTRRRRPGPAARLHLAGCDEPRGRPLPAP